MDDLKLLELNELTEILKNRLDLKEQQDEKVNDNNLNNLSYNHVNMRPHSSHSKKKNTFNGDMDLSSNLHRPKSSSSSTSRSRPGSSENASFRSKQIEHGQFGEVSVPHTYGQQAGTGLDLNRNSHRSLYPTYYPESTASSSLFRSTLDNNSKEEEEKKKDVFIPYLTAMKPIPRNVFEKKKAKHPKFKRKPEEAWPEETLGIGAVYVPDAITLQLQNQLSQEKSFNTNNIGTSAVAGEEKQLILSPIKVRRGKRRSALEAQQREMNKESNLQRLKLISNAESIINEMPLSYLISKEELRSFAFERACKIIAALAKKSILSNLKKAFKIWVKPPEIKLNDKQVGFLVIAARLEKWLKRLYVKFFMHWAKCYATKFNEERKKLFLESALKIQSWWKLVTMNTRKAWLQLIQAMEMCMQRRRAINHALKFENSRTYALEKMRKGIASRRRWFFGARSIKRVRQWVLLYRQTRWRLIRQHYVRQIQRWRRMIMMRHPRDLYLIRKIISLGGYSRVFSKMPSRHLRNGELASLDSCVSMIQKAYYQSKGRMDAYLAAAAKRAREAYEAMLNENAVIIQNSYQAHIWDQLILAAVINNRARRLSKAFRAYQWRVPEYYRALRRKDRVAKKIQKFLRFRMWIKLLAMRFKLRKYVLVMTRGKQSMASTAIQRCYRAYVIYQAWKKEELRKFYAQQRANIQLTLKAASKIQRNYRQQVHTEGEHVKLCALRIVSKRRNEEFRSIIRIQHLAKKYIIKQRETDERRRVQAANTIWWLTKSYLLRLKMYDRVYETRIRKNNSANHITRFFRNCVLKRWILIKVAVRAARNTTEMLRQHAAEYIQKRMFRKKWENRLPLRLAGRIKLKANREREYMEWIWRMRDRASRKISKLMHEIVRWEKFLRRLEPERQYYLEINMARRICRFAKGVVYQARFRDYMLIKMKHIEDEEIRRAELWAANRIGFNWRRKQELKMLDTRFTIRHKTLELERKLVEERKVAYEERDEAVDERIKVEETMAATIAASWKQGSDINGRNYFYNYVTGESSWDPPPDWKSKVQDIWVRQVDNKQQVYYYNMKTGETRWLAPCVICGKGSDRWCADCRVSYCEKDYKKMHEGEGAHPDMAEHDWSAAEIEKDVLKPGEVYCIECKRRNGVRMCTTCWDPYCDTCYKGVHHKGALRGHDYISYKEAKLGWMIVKAKFPGEDDYYVHGTTGETTYTKPFELMTESEKIFYNNFMEHKRTAEEHVQRIDELQVELESAKYDRDMLMYDALQGGGGGALQNIMKKQKKTGAKVAGASEIMNAMGQNKKKGFLGGLFGGGQDQMYRAMIMAPSDRARGKNRSDYIKGLLDNVGDVLKDAKKENK